MLEIAVMQLAEPKLEFGNGFVHSDPKVGLANGGPFSLRYYGAHPEGVRIGIVGPAHDVAVARAWFERCQHRILSAKENRRRFPDFPGFRAAFRSELYVDARWSYELPALPLATSLVKPDLERFNDVLEMYLEGVARLSQMEMGPNVIVCAISDEIFAACADVTLERVRSYRRRVTDPNQLSLDFDFGRIEPPPELVYRRLREALKAKVMQIPRARPTQIVTSHLLIDGPGRDDPATRAWSVSGALYFKAYGLPWRLAGLAPHACFVGISFHRNRTTHDETTYSSVAQAFSTEIEGFILRGERLAKREDRQLLLTGEQAERLGRRIFEKYTERAGRPPVRVTLHKTTPFSADERAGFHAALRDLPALELISVADTDVRLIAAGDYPPARGTVATIGHDTHLLYTTGYYDQWQTYPGPRIPAPLRVRLDDAPATDLRRICEETLGLTKMNWNDVKPATRSPITLHMAREVGPIIRMVPDDVEPSTDYRFYV